jgi:predicted Zn-dependent peptidase
MKTFYKVVNITIILICFSVYSLQAQSNFKSPAYEHFILDNGLEVYMVVQKEVPLVHFRAVVPAGVRQDSDEYAGLSELTANLLSSGTASYDKETIETTLDFIGASYNSSSNMETSVLTSSFINKDSELVLPILIEMLTKPSFKEAEFLKLKQRAVAGVDQSRESPRSVINNYFNQLVYGDHPYANIPSGTKKSIERIELKDVNRFYSDHYTPMGSVIAVVGDFNPTEMKNQLTNLFSSWNNVGKAKNNSTVLPSLDSSRVVVVNKEDARETTLLIGGVGVSEKCV